MLESPINITDVQHEDSLTFWFMVTYVGVGCMTRQISR